MSKIVLLLLITLPMIISFQNSSTCSSQQFFDTTIMNCRVCPANQTANTTSQLSCFCNANYIIGDENQIGFEGTCLKCGAVI